MNLAWDITVDNEADTRNSQTVFITDNATFFSAGGGTCPSAVPNVTDLTAGIICTVGPDSTLTVTVRKPFGPAATCAEQTINNTATIRLNNAQGKLLGPNNGVVGGGPATEFAIAGDPSKCNGTIAVKKVRDPGAAFAADGTPFGGTIDGTSWSGFITFGGVTTPKSVNAGSHSVVENTPGNGWVLVGYQVLTNSSTTAACSTNPANYSKSAGNAVTATVTTGQLTLVCVMNTRASTPTVTPDCPNCTPLIVSTPTPTSTPVRPTNTPVNTPVPPSAVPTTPLEAVAGETTPGPGALSTPIAPSAGTGISGSGSSFNGFLALIGIVILGSGMALMAAGRRGKRN